MDELVNDLKVMCTLNIRRLYPDWKQAQAWQDMNIMADFFAWRDANKDFLKAQIARVEAGEDIDLSEGWPCPKEWVPVPKEEGETWKSFDELNRANEAERAHFTDFSTLRPKNVDAFNHGSGPPEALKEYFTSDRSIAAQAKALWQKYNDLTNKIMLATATDEERKKHSRLQGELDWIKRHAFEGV